MPFPFWSSITAGLAYVSIALFVYFLYFRLLPFLEREEVTYKTVLGWRHGFRGWFWKTWFEASIIVVFLVIFLSLLVWIPVVEPTKDFWFDLFIARQIQNGSHISSYAVASGIVLISSLYFKDALKGLLYGGNIIVYHEGLWFLGYYFVNWETGTRVNWILDVGFIVWLFFMFWAGRKVYRFRLSYPALAVYVGYLIAWVRIGFPVTVTNQDIGYYGESVFYYSYMVNMVEVGSWLLILGVFLWSLRLNKKTNREKVGVASPDLENVKDSSARLRSDTLNLLDRVCNSSYSNCVWSPSLEPSSRLSLSRRSLLLCFNGRTFGNLDGMGNTHFFSKNGGGLNFC